MLFWCHASFPSSFLFLLLSLKLWRNPPLPLMLASLLLTIRRLAFVLSRIWYRLSDSSVSVEFVNEALRRGFLTDICLSMTWCGWNWCPGWQNIFVTPWRKLSLSYSLLQYSDHTVLQCLSSLGPCMSLDTLCSSCLVFFLLNQRGPFATTSMQLILSKLFWSFLSFTAFLLRVCETQLFLLVLYDVSASSKQWITSLFPASVHMKAPLETSFRGLVACGLTATFQMQILGYPIDVLR